MKLIACLYTWMWSELKKNKGLTLKKEPSFFISHISKIFVVNHYLILLKKKERKKKNPTTL